MRSLANEGRTVVSTIHQPSSEVFYEFDKLLLIVEGRCIYKGDSSEAETHFKSIGYECPPLMNLAEFYMDMMSFQFEAKEGMEERAYEQAREEHNSKQLKLEQEYRASKYYTENLKVK